MSSEDSDDPESSSRAELANPRPDGSILTLDDLANLVSFVTPNYKPEFRNEDIQFTSCELSVLTSLISMGTEIEHMPFFRELRGSKFCVSLGTAIRKNRTIHSMVLSGNPMETSRFPRLARMFRSAASPRLERFNLHCIDFRPQEAKILAEALGECTGLKILELEFFSIGYGSVCKLAKGITMLTSLESVTINTIDMGIDVDMVNEFAEALGKLPKLSGVMLEHVDDCSLLVKLGLNRIRRLGISMCDGGMLALLSGFTSHRVCALEEMQLRDNKMCPEESKELAQVILRVPHLTRLDISNNPKLGTCSTIGSAIKRSCSTSLTQLKMRNCKVGREELVAMLGPMRGMFALTHLDLASNAAGDVGAKAVAELMLDSAAASLQELNMSYNDISEEGAASLAVGLAKATSIVSIALNDNNIGPKGATLVLDALTSQPQPKPLELISLRACGIGYQGAAAVARLISKRGCGNVDLTDNGIGAGGIRQIAGSLHDSSIIMDLALSYNPCGKKGAKCIAGEIVKKNQTVRCLNIQHVYMDVKELARAVMRRDPKGPLKVLCIEPIVKRKAALEAALEAVENMKKAGLVIDFY